MNMMSVTYFYQLIVKGLVILVTVPRQRLWDI